MEGVGRISETLNERDAQLRKLLENANKATGVLANAAIRSSTWCTTPTPCWCSCRRQSAALDADLRQHLGGQSTDQGFHRRTATPQARDRQAQRCTGDRRQPQAASAEVHQGAQQVRDGLWASRSGRDRFSRLTSSTCCQASSCSPSSTRPSPIWDSIRTCCCRPSAPTRRSDSPARRRLPVPYPRTGQGGEPRMTIPDAITGNPATSRAVRPASRCPAQGATRIANRRPLRRPAARHRDRPPKPRPARGPRRAYTARTRSTCRRPTAPRLHRYPRKADSDELTMQHASDSRRCWW